MSLFKLFNIFSRRARATLEIYTDGSFKNGRGSWAFVMLRNGVVMREASGTQRKTNSLRMEMQAVIEALRSLPESSAQATVYCDSRPVLDLFLRGVYVSSSKPNYDLVSQLLILNQKHTINWRWVKAHSGKMFNERCDELCVQARSASC